MPCRWCSSTEGPTRCGFCASATLVTLRGSLGGDDTIDWAQLGADGDEITQGTVLGVVGTTGNAPPNAPHLHFQVMRMPNDTRYWEGMPVDVRPFLVRNGAQK